MAEFESDLIRARTRDAIAAATAAGKMKGRTHKLTRRAGLPAPDVRDSTVQDRDTLQEHGVEEVSALQQHHPRTRRTRRSRQRRG
ncbi:hypothetical protein ACFWQG_08805 [Rhodococcus sp. NPDC058532]